MPIKQEAPAEPLAEIPAEPIISTPEPEIIYKAFDENTLYTLLVAELAGGRNRFDIMLGNYVQQAQSTRDAGVVARASRLARFINATKPAVEMSLLWTEIEPENNEAHLNATAALIMARRYIEAFEHGRILLERDHDSGLDSLGAATSRAPKEVVQTLRDEYTKLSSDFPQDARLLLGLCYLENQLGHNEEALKACQASLVVKADSLPARAQEARLLMLLGKNTEAQASFKKLVEDYPENTRLRLNYARSLSRTDLNASAEQFAKLNASLPNDPDIALALGLVYYQLKKFDEAQQTLNQLVDMGRHQSTAHYYLGQIEERRGNSLDALSHLSKVQPGSDYARALGQITQILERDGKPGEALSFLTSRRKNDSNEYLEESYLLESEIYIRQGNFEQADATLTHALSEIEGSARLLYARAMLYSQMDNLQGAESDLRSVIAQSPDNAVALNALGYTLADKTERLEEAYEYINRAYQLNPDSAAVIDSMGWVLYRLGQHRKALSYLREAHAKYPDHEIAAHLGEVLWVMGKRKEAKTVWKDALKKKPDSVLIKNTLRRLNATLH